MAAQNFGTSLHIKNGPSKWDLILSLFEPGLCLDGERLLKFVVEKASKEKTSVHIWVRRIEKLGQINSPDYEITGEFDATGNFWKNYKEDGFFENKVFVANFNVNDRTGTFMF